MDKHVTVVGSLHIGYSALGILAGLVLFVLLVGIGFLADDQEALNILTLIASVVGVFLVVTAIPGIIGGIGLLKRQAWARILLLILSVFDLFAIPIGTALGVYTIWVLLQDETEQLFACKPSE